MISTKTSSSTNDYRYVISVSALFLAALVYTFATLINNDEQAVVEPIVYEEQTLDTDTATFVESDVNASSMSVSLSSEIANTENPTVTSSSASAESYSVAAGTSSSIDPELTLTSYNMLDANAVSESEIIVDWQVDGQTSLTALSSVAGSDSSAQIFWFYNPPKEGDCQTLIENYDYFVLTQETQWRIETLPDCLKAGGKTDIIQYIRMDAVQDPCMQALLPTGTPCSCDQKNWSNNVAWNPDDICMIRDEHPDWFLRSTDGDIIYEGIDYGSPFVYMDPGNPEWQEFWLERAILSQQTYGWHGVFLDNLEGGAYKHHEYGLANYPDSASFQQGWVSFLQYIRNSYFGPNNVPLLANIVSRPSWDVWHTYMPYLDGAMEESWAVDWGDDYYSVSFWEQSLSSVEQTSASGKRSLLVAQGDRYDEQRQGFSFASYLLVSSEYVAFRYTQGYTGGYHQAWLYDNYELELGQPLGARYQDGDRWVREFANGTVWVNPEDHTWDIKYQEPDLLSTVLDVSLDGGETVSSTIAVALTDNTYAHAGLAPNTEYCYRLRMGSDSESLALTDWACDITDDIQAPILVNPGDQQNIEEDIVSLAINVLDPDNRTLTLFAEGLPPGLEIASDTGVISGTIAPESEGQYVVNLTAANDAGKEASITFNWLVDPLNHAPTITAIVDQVNTEEDSVSLTLIGSDVDGGALTYSISNLPTSLTFNALTGEISSVLADGTAGNYALTATVTDEGGLSASTTFNWTVEELNHAPSIAAIADQLNTEEDSVSLTLRGSDVDGDALTYAISNLPTSLTFNALTGEISGVLADGTAGNYALTATVTDEGGLSASTTFNWTVEELNHAPTITAIPDQLNTEEDSVSLTLTGSDVDGDALTYAISNLPSSLSFNALTGVISGTLADGTAGQYTLTAIVTDEGGLSASMTFNWTVEELNHAPSIAAVADQVNTEEDSVSLTLTGSDVDGGALVYAISNLPNSLSFNALTGEISGTLADGTAGQYTLTAIVTDEGGLSASMTFNWTVEELNHAPSIAAIADQVNTEEDSVFLTLTGSDVDGGTLVYAISNLPSSLSFNALTGEISGILTDGTTGQYTVTATVTDKDGLSASTTFKWTVLDLNHTPSITGIPDQVNTEEDSVSLTLTGSDADGDAIIYAISNLPSSLSFNPVTGAISGVLADGTAGQYTVTATVTDDGGLSVSTTFIWNVMAKNHAPTLASISDQANHEKDSVSIQIIAGDPDNDTLTYSVAGLPKGLAFNDASKQIVGTIAEDSEGTYFVDIHVVDAGNLGVSTSFLWTVVKPKDEGAVAAATCNSYDDPKQVLSASEIKVSYDEDSGTFTARSTVSNSSACTYEVGMAAYQKTNQGWEISELSDQLLVDWTPNSISPASYRGDGSGIIVPAAANGTPGTVDLSVTFEACATQIDVVFDANHQLGYRFDVSEQAEVDKVPLIIPQFNANNSDWGGWRGDSYSNADRLLTALQYDQYYVDNMGWVDLPTLPNCGIDESELVVEETATPTDDMGIVSEEETVIEETPVTEDPLVETTPEPTSDAGIIVVEEPSASVAAITGFILVDADNNVDLMTLSDGMIVDLNGLPVLSIVATVASGDVDSVVFELSGASELSRVELGVPFALGGDIDADYDSVSFPIGAYTIIATPYYQSEAGQSMTINFLVTDSTPVVVEPVVEETPVVEEPVVEETPVEQAAVEENPVAEETPIVEEPAVEEPMVEETPVEQVPAEPVVEETPVEQVPAEPVVEETPVEQVPAEPVVEEPEPVVVESEPVIEETPVEQAPTEPVVEEPEPVVEEAPAEEPTAEEPVEEASAEESVSEGESSEEGA